VFWFPVWRLIEGDQAWGRQFFTEFLAFTDEGASLLPALTPEDAGRLLDWVLKTFPVDDDSSNEGGIVGPRDHMRFFRNALIERLRQAGTRDACVALRAVRDAHPEYPWLSEVLLHAQAVERQSSWSPLTAAVWRRLFADRRARFITTTTQHRFQHLQPRTHREREQLAPRIDQEVDEREMAGRFNNGRTRDYARLLHGGSLLAGFRPGLVTTRLPRAVRSRRSQISTIRGTSPE